MSTSRTGRCLMGAEEDGGDLADQPHQPAGGEQQRRHHQPEGVRDVLVLAVGVAVTPHRRRLLARRRRARIDGPRAGRCGSGGARERHRRYWPGRTHVLEDNALGPPTVGRGPGPAGRSGTPACCRTGRCWPPRMDVPPGTDLVIQAEVHAESQHQPAHVASGDRRLRPGAEVPAGSFRPRRRAVGEWLRRMPGTRPGLGNGHRGLAPATLVWRPRGSLPRGSRPLVHVGREEDVLVGRGHHAPAGRAVHPRAEPTSRGGYRPARPPPRLARRERAEASARRAMCAGRAGRSADATLLGAGTDLDRLSAQTQRGRGLPSERAFPPGCRVAACVCGGARHEDFRSAGVIGR